jgi:uncharacterized protein (DUF362 family)
MSGPVVALVRYAKPFESVRRAVTLAGGLEGLPCGARVFVKPNIVFWTRSVPFPKWGVITTSRVVEDVVALLKEHGAGEILIGEGPVVPPGDKETIPHAFEALGYRSLEKRYGVRCIDIFKRPFEAVDLGDGLVLNFNADILASDFVVDLPVLKTHAQTVVSLGIKNLKGTIDIASRKKCHSPDAARGLDFCVARLADPMPPMLTVIDGIFSCERGPGFDGRMHRSDILAASADVLAADMVGARLLGYDPAAVPHLALAARNRGRTPDTSDLTVAGEAPEALAAAHEYRFAFNADGSLPVVLEKMGISGVSYREYDSTLCTYCSLLSGLILTAIARAWRGIPYEGVEILNGKAMTPTPGMKKTILLGRCMTRKNLGHPNIREVYAVKGCPPRSADIVKALHWAGIPVDPDFIRRQDLYPAIFGDRYKGRPEFDESLFRVDAAPVGSKP